YHSGIRLIRDFIRVSEPLAIDPHWNRLWALIWEGPRGDPSEAIEHWMGYLSDLESVPGFTAQERPLALALTWKHVAELYLDLEASSDLALTYHQLNEPAAALEYIERARKLKPLDEPLKSLEVAIRISLARSLALKKQWDEGRDQFAAIERLEPGELREYSYLA